ncbi:MAG TPA: S1/P1 nuclease, partial [Nitrospiraceae bacterium]|nr:S1/P1 nuclease [Nitrospiraceae bacterium]
MSQKIALFRKTVVLLCLCATCLVPAELRAWGQEGHRIIAAIGESRLQQHAAENVRELLGDGSLSSIANWADEIRRDRPETAPWHFVDIPRDRQEYDPTRDCAFPHKGDCVVAAIERYQVILADLSRSKQDRAEALKFLIHLVGDVHQPLHCLKDHEGGTTLDVLFYGERINPFNEKLWNLHAVWDVGLIQHAGLSEEAYIRTLNDWLERQSVEELQQGTAREWA